MVNIVIPAITKTITGSGDGQSVGSKKIVLNTKDTYVPEDIEVNVSATVNVAAASLANAATNGQTYTENTANATIIPAGGALYINKGWINNTKITLGHMIPDDVDYTNAGVAHIRAGFEAYNTEGNKLIGTMPNTNLSSSGGEMSGTLNLDDGTINVTPSVTGTGVSATQGQTYGVTTTQPTSGVDGTAYLTFNPDATGGTKTTSASIKVTRGAVTTSGIPGYYDGSDVILAAGEQSFTETADISTNIKAGTNYYMPIVTIAGTGGAVSKSSGSGSVTGTKPNVAVTYSGKFTELGTSGVGKNYGIIEGTPETGQDGTNYLSIVTTATPDAAQTWSGTATINYSRGEVKSNATKAGAIKVTTSTSLLASTTGSLSHEISGSVQATTSGAKTYSIPIVSVSHSGGGVTATASGTEKKVAKATAQANIIGKTSSGATVTPSNYGFVAANEDSATSGYITVYSSASSTTKPVITAKADANRAAVTYTNSAGAIIAHNNTTALSSANATQNTKDIEGSDVAIAYNTAQRAYKIKIVSPVGTGGAVSVSATASISPVGENGSTAPEVTINYSGYINDHASDYGIVYEEPSEFADGDNYSLLRVSNTNTDGLIVGSVSGSYDRAAVTAADAYQGAVSMTTSTQLLAAASNKPISGTFTTGSIGAEVTGQKNIYIPISQHEITGGGMTLNSFSVSGPKTLAMTPSTSFKKGTGSTGSASAATISDYGITKSKPTTDWVLFDPVVSNGTNTSGTHTISLSGTASINRAAVTATATPGITTQAQWSQAASTKQFSGSGSWSYTLESGQDYYIPVVSPTASVSSHTTSDGSASASEKAAFKIQGVGQTLPAGVQILTSAPSDLNTNPGGYIIVEPNVSVTNGSSSATGMAVINAGITTGTGTSGVTSVASTKTVTVTNIGATSKCYIKVWKADGGFTIS